jgi:hypothetical protein
MRGFFNSFPDEVPYITSDLLTNNEPQEVTELPRSLIIVGGGYIAGLLRCPPHAGEANYGGALLLRLFQSGLATILDVGTACGEILIQGVFGGRIVSAKLVGQGAQGIG